MKAIILAAGRGSRMGKNTDEIPKCLTNLFGKTLIELEIDAIRKSNITEIGVVTGYLSEKINIPNVNYFNNKDWKKTNMVRSLYCADNWISENDCIISYSDIVYQSEAVKTLKSQKQDIVVLYNTNWLKLWKERFNNPLDDAETFKIDENNRIIEIGKKTSNINDIEGQYMGLLKVTVAGWKIIKKYLNTISDNELNKLDITALLSNLLQTGIDIYGVSYSGLWLEIDNENDLNLYQQNYHITKK